MNGFLLFLIILNAYILLVYLAARSGILARFNIGLMGPALMFRTQRGKGIIDWISKLRRTWVLTGTWGVWLVLGTMFAMTALLIIQIPALFRIPVDQAPGARQILALPGINPLIPIWYGIAALIIAIVIHEFAHGILARAQDMKVKALGMLYLIVPIGAFVEPDEEQLMASSRIKRMRVYAAGPTSNLVTTVICGVLFSAVFMASAAPVGDGLGVRHSIEYGPAFEAGLEPGMLLTHIDSTPIPNNLVFQDVLGQTVPGQEIVVQTQNAGSFTFCLGSRNNQTDIPDLGHGYNYCSLYSDEARAAADANPEGDHDRGFLGVEMYPLSPGSLRDRLAHPMSSLPNFVLYIALPFTGYTPIDAPMTELYTTPWDDTLGPTAFWITANLAYWVMWISLMLGLTNALPAVPLDGGFLFRDFVESVLGKFRSSMSEERKAHLAKRASVFISFTILGLILLQFAAPYIAQAFAS